MSNASFTCVTYLTETALHQLRSWVGRNSLAVKLQQQMFSTAFQHLELFGLNPVFVETNYVLPQQFTTSYTEEVQKAGARLVVVLSNMIFSTLQSAAVQRDILNVVILKGNDVHQPTVHHHIAYST